MQRTIFFDGRDREWIEAVEVNDLTCGRGPEVTPQEGDKILWGLCSPGWQVPDGFSATTKRAMWSAYHVSTLHTKRGGEMDREKFVFKMRTEWSDCSEHSPTRMGQLPSVAVLPTGERVDVTAPAVMVAAWNRNVLFDRGWVKLDHGVSARESSWGDDGSKSVGRSGAKVEVLAPEGTKFLFTQECSSCGEFLAEIKEDELGRSGCAPEAYCDKCTARIAEQDAAMESMRQALAD